MPLTAASLGTIVGLLITAWFAVLCRRNMRLAIMVFVAIAWVPFIRVFDLPGSRITQNLLLVELLPTVMIAVWWLGRLRAERSPLVETRFNRPLALLVAWSIISLVASLTIHDPSIPAEHVKLSVSVGQILLIAWPAGLYLVVANAKISEATARSVVRLIMILALPSFALPILPQAWRTYVGWSIYFALAVSPLCLAMSFDSRSIVRKLGLWALAALPLVYGILIGKAFLYVTIAVGLAVVAFLRAGKLLAAALPVALGIYVLSVAGSDSYIPTPLQPLVNVERQQQSWGGRAGRIELAADAIRIWSRYPIFGVGPGNSWPFMHRYSVIDTPHNQYLNILLELGLVGLLLFLWFIAGALRTGFDALGSAGPGFPRTLVIGWLGLFSGMLVGGLTGDFIFHSIRNGGLGVFSGYYLQWVFLGMVVSAGETGAWEA